MNTVYMRTAYICIGALSLPLTGRKHLKTLDEINEQQLFNKQLKLQLVKLKLVLLCSLVRVSTLSAASVTIHSYFSQSTPVISCPLSAKRKFKTSLSIIDNLLESVTLSWYYWCKKLV